MGKNLKLYPWNGHNVVNRLWLICLKKEMKKIIFTKDDLQMGKKHMRRCSSSLIPEEMQVKSQGCLKLFANLINPPSTLWCGSYYLRILQIRRKGPERASKVLEVTLLIVVEFWTLFNFYWYVVGLQCCVNFRCTEKWISDTYSHCFFRFFSHIGRYRVLSIVSSATQ